MERLTNSYARGVFNAAAAFGVRTAGIMQMAVPLAGMVGGGPAARHLAGKYAPKMNLKGWKGTALDIGGSMAGQMVGEKLITPTQPQEQQGPG